MRTVTANWIGVVIVLAVRSMVVTSRPLAASMILTVIVASLRPSLADMLMAHAGVNNLNV